MPESVRITDVSPRDGLQNEPGVIPTTDKAHLINLLSTTGVDEVEVTSFVSAKWVPQLGDAKELLKAISELPLPEGGGRGVGSSTSPARMNITRERARALRNAATGPEQELWKFLRNREFMGVKFRRQHPFGPYILDFYCVEKNLAVEVDGRSHGGADAQEYDATRDQWIAQHGVRILRFTNDEVIANGSAVAYQIRDTAQAMPSSGRESSRDRPPLPEGGGRGVGSSSSSKTTIPTRTLAQSPFPLFSALVPNIQGFQAALEANRSAHHRLLSKVSVFTAASETFSKKNTNATIAETLERFRPVITSAHTEGLLVRAYISCVVACPFEGPIAPQAVAHLARQLLELGADEIDLGDTIGAATPDSLTAMLKAYEQSNPLRHSRIPTTLHLHDTFGRAADCVKTALDLGIRSFDGSVAGLGGCPYASTPTKRAPGNIATETLVRTIHQAGYATAVNLDKLAEAAAFAREIVAKSRAGAQP